MEVTEIAAYGNELVKARAFADLRNTLAKNSPEILVGAGVVGVLVSTVLACKATLKATDKLEVAKQKFSDIKEMRSMSLRPEALNGLVDVDYPYEEYRRDLVVASVQTVVDFGKLYAIPVALMGVSLFAIFKGHGITMKRNAGLASAVTAVTAGYNAYRKRVEEKLGAEAEEDIYFGRQTEVVEATDAKGKTIKKKVSTLSISPEHSVYAKFFDDASRNWQPSPELNMTFLRCQQNYANDKLRINKVLFLNEVYDMLGLTRTQAGAVVGWAVTGDGDNYVDFGIYNGDDWEHRRFVNGDEHSILLDFNVNGVVYDLL